MKRSEDSIIRQFSQLPVTTTLDQLMSALSCGHAVLNAPTGSGKTTLVPLVILERVKLRGLKIIMLEPRRIAARAAAVRMSSMLGENVGTTVGYRTRFESRISQKTRIEVVTEGILIRKLQHDPELSDTALVIFDEFHERNLQADLGLALCLDLCELRDDLRLLVMSATLDSERISEILGDAPAISSKGKSHNVEISYLPSLNSNSSITNQMLNGVRKAWQNTSGDILAFLPGAGEIRRCQKLIEDEINDALILPLYGNLSHTEQDRIFQTHKQKRRIILATPIAETSLTIEGISCVVDSGYFRHPVYDQRSGLTRLATSRISQASAQQRTGRAGRLGPGHCYRLWSKEVDHSLLAHTPPEILQADLSDLVLELALWGITDPEQLSWIDTPRESAWEKAVKLLTRLDLLDKRKRISQAGKIVAALPVHPRLGVILHKGVECGHSWTACLLAAVLTERDIFRGDSGRADIEARVRILADLDTNRTKNVGSHVDIKLCQRLLRQAGEWFSKLPAKDNRKSVAFAELGNLLAFGFPDRIGMLRAGTTYSYKLANGRGAELSPGDILSGTRFIVAPQVDARKGDGKIFMAAEITEQDIITHHNHLLTKLERVFWDENTNRVNASKDVCLEKLTLSSKPLKRPDTTKVAAAFLNGIQLNGLSILPWTKDARDLQARLDFLHHRQPESWPDVSDNTLSNNLDWLAPYCLNMSKIGHLQDLNMKSVLLSLLSWEKQVQLDTLAPTHIPVPSGSRIRITYNGDEPPILAVRLQELFGQIDTPRICNEKIPVLLHLLSPARRPMQITSDLHSFWVNTYPEVRKELAGRYPKHYWPENPLEAEATSKTKKHTRSKKR
ncbi:ATP-dependent helicase HrpB [Desulfosediminicola flagellatus]|uniref:ATP-dependent helicase HrpB n=1 Tax=Desulfosediminicola flagellatus TaxID=2569541 RepID=UPI0010AB614F|nr:ATP-dependent helicase HrpB [Desulfosediminicola flagellatus]